MNIDEMTIRVRERNMAENIDLALMLCMRHKSALIKITLLALIPHLAVTWWLVDSQWDFENGQGIYQLIILFLIMPPILTAPITLYLGQAMFSHDPKLRTALTDAVKRLPALIGMAITRFIFGFALLPYIFLPPQMSEVVLLEKPGGMRAAWSRSWRLSRFYFGENIGLLLVTLILYVAWLLVATVSAYTTINTLHWGLNPETTPWTYLLGYAFWPSAIGLVFLVFATVLRFAAYLDLRTRREGWEVELDLRRAGQQLEGLQQ